MRDASAWFRLRSLEAAALQAGSTMACAFGSSAEFDAALIRARVQAGAYGPKRTRRRMLAALMTVSLFIAFLLMAL
jgi:hypothetical protein